MVKSSFFVVDGRAFEVKGISEDDFYVNHITGRFEGKFQDFCQTYLEEESIALDVGANIGATSIILSHYLSKGKIFAFEPGKNVFKSMQDNLVRNNLSNVMAYNYALSDKSENVAFIENSAHGHIDKSSSSSQASLAEENSIMALTLDDLVEQLGLERLDFIKVDIEGFEPQFFAGATKTIERFNPIIYFELNTWCLLSQGKNDPIEFMKQITDSFKFVYRMHKDEGSPRILEQVNSNRPLHYALIHDNIVFCNSVNDIVVSNNNRISLEAVAAAESRSALNTANTTLSKAYNTATALRTYKHRFFIRTARRIVARLLRLFRARIRLI